MKPRQTEIDYAVIAINPALIMLLVGSLVYFLLALFYNGSFDLRLNFILGAFVFSIVLIARISIEESWQRATVFALALSGAVLMAVLRFIPDAVSITMALLAVVWWSANRLTYDCTVVDDSEDASNKGLMQNLETTNEQSQPDQATLDGVTNTAEETQTKTHWLAELINPTSTHHAPGMWVVYFSLAALPIFGLGQAFVTTSVPADRFYLFCLLFVYVASALLLLVSTSFLGLRRYLRQRGIEMPLAMTGTWLGAGAVIVLLVLLVCSVVPRPNAEYQLAQLPQFGDGKKQQQSNQHSVGKEGTDDKNPDARKTSGEQKDQNDSESKENQKNPKVLPSKMTLIAKTQTRTPKKIVKGSKGSLVNQKILTTSKISQKAIIPNKTNLKKERAKRNPKIPKTPVNKANKSPIQISRSKNLIPTAKSRILKNKINRNSNQNPNNKTIGHRPSSFAASQTL